MNKVRYIILFLSVLILIYEIVSFDLSKTMVWKEYLGPLVPILLIISIYGSIRHENKNLK